MFTRDNNPDVPHAEALEPGEQPVAPPLRVIVWGPHRPLSGGPLTVTDRYLRFTPAWKGTDAVLSSTPAASPGPQLKIPRGDLLRVEWERTMVFLKNLKIETSSGELFLLAGRDTLEQLSAALGGAR